MDSNKTKREREHLSYQKMANEIFDKEFKKKEESSRENFDNFQNQMKSKENELAQLKKEHQNQMSNK